MLEVTLKIRLELRGPILSHATAIGAFGIDAPMARDSQDRYYLPYSLVRGRLRQSWQELHEATGGVFDPQIDDRLGPAPPASGGTQNRLPQRGRLRFSDFQHDGNGIIPNLMHRIRIDGKRGAVAQGAIQVMESPFAPDQSANFRGTISYLARDDTEADAIRSDIEKGLRWTTHFGGERTIGFGRLAGLEVTPESLPIEVKSITTIEAGTDPLYLSIQPQAPFCISKRRVNPNFFESDIILSGGVLRGSLATTLQLLCGLPRNAVIDDQLSAPWKELGAYFDKIRFSHAFPAKEGAYKRPVVAPLSLVKALVKDATETWYDVALCEGPLLIGSPLRAPSFAMDWKHSDDVQAYFGWAEPKREIRVRTAMNRTYRRAEDEKLFAYEMVVPTGYFWHGTVDLSQVSDSARGTVEAQLCALLKSHGLKAVGKTKAPAIVTIPSRISPVHPSDPNPISDKWVVTLQTPALLCDPQLLNEASGQRELFAAYDAVWHQLSNGALKLVRFFACQSLEGDYLGLRFQPDQPYNPFLLTDPGSVFVLQATGDISAAQAVIKRWLREGLRLPDWAKQRYGDHWSTCPFLSADGFGEIAVNLSCHTLNQPPPEVCHVI